MGEDRKESIRTDPEFVIVRPYKSHEEMLRILGSHFKARHNSSRDGAIQAL